MIWRAIVLLFATLLPAHAAPVELRSGEHADFSRIVMPLPALDAWKLEETEDGFLLHSGIADAEFALQNVFRFIPRTRLQEIESLSGGVLGLKTTEGTYAKAFALAPNLLVIDFFTGAPGGPLAEAQSAALPEGTQPPLASAPQSPPSEETPRSTQPVAIDQSYLDLFWRDQEDGEASGPTTPPPQPQIHDAAPRPTLPREPDPQVAEIEEKLARQLARASAQGLIVLEREDLLPVKDPMPESSHEETEASPRSDTESPAVSEPSMNDHIAFKSTTVIDRDQLHLTSPSRMKTGMSCAPDALFDIGRWVDDRDPVEQIRDARSALVGEFDIPDQERVIALARVYIAFGFGAEARALLEDLAVSDDPREALLYLGAVLDEDPRAAHNLFATMSECDGFVALWGFLGATPVPKKDTVNFAALQRSFRALPPPLRKAIAPRLSDRLIEIGATDIARALRPALARVTREDHGALDIVDAHLAAEKSTASAEPKLRALASQNGPENLRAIVLLIKHQIDSGGPVDRALIETAESFAFELQGTEETPDLSRAIVLGHGVNNEFVEAFRWLDQIDFHGDRSAESEMSERLIGLLTRHADEATFLNVIYTRPKLLQQAAQDPELRADVAQRLLELGMAGPATRLLKAGDPITEKDRLLLGAAALAAFDPAAALAHLNGVEGSEADRLRAQAFSRLGQHGAARDAYVRAGADTKARVEAWRETDWQGLRTTDDPLTRRFVETFGTPTPSPEDASGPITQARSLLEASRTEREVMREILDQLEQPRSKSPE